VRQILIVGGGSSGWMAATLLNKRLPDASITLIEASDIPIIGVGESTNTVVRYFNQVAGIEERAFMRATNGAFKIAIRFQGFNERNSVFFHPFGRPPNLAATLFKADAQTHHDSYGLASTGNLFSRECAYAYQIDAGLYGQHLKECCKQRGVRHIVDRVLSAEVTPTGDIACIHTANAGPLRADLYVDCSGFRAFLLDKTLHEPFHAATRHLLNDRAVAGRLPYIDRDSEIKTFTNCTALSAGWVWQIPLWSRLGTGYVYSSAFLSPSEAETELREFLGVERVKDLQFNHIEIRAGRHERAWVGNCVGIGVSYGFLEPLESTGLSLTQVALIDLARELSHEPLAEARDRFNRRQAAIFDTTRDFVLAHFVLTSRDDTPYWRHIRHMKDLPDSLLTVLEHALLRSYAPLERLAHTFYDQMNWNLILSGMGMFGAPASAYMGPPLPAAALHAEILRRSVHDEAGDEKPEFARAAAAGHPMWFPTW
jgi:hypothetical protein